MTEYPNELAENKAFVERGKLYANQQFNFQSSNINLTGMILGILRKYIISVSISNGKILVTCVANGVEKHHIIDFPPPKRMPGTIEGDLAEAHKWLAAREDFVKLIVNDSHKLTLANEYL